jgi:4-carboxymuconolactone decarboxylase
MLDYAGSPYGVLLHSPDLAARVAHTGTYGRYNLELPEALRETIIIATAREIKNQDEAMLVRYVQELLRNHKISNATFNAVRDRFGMQKSLEITGLIGHYLLVGQILAAFEVELPEGAKAEIPE